MRVLLIGGEGFIGRHLAARLDRAGCAVFIAGRDMDYEPLLESVDVVINLASETTPGSSQAMPTREIGNIATTLRLAEALLDRPTVRLIFLSSGGTVYGNSSFNSVPENCTLAPRSFHGASKVASEFFFGVLRQQGRQVLILRPSNAYGPGQPLRSGFGFVRTVLEHARTGEALRIWGDGNAVRDFVFVEDVAEAITRMVLLRLSEGVFNLGSGIGHSLNQVLAIARQVTGREIPVLYEMPRCGDVLRSVLDVGQLERIMGWRPAVSLDEGVGRTWEWLEQEQDFVVGCKQ